MSSLEEYRVALEFAATSRYEEAESKLQHIIEEQPGNVEALILLAKVKYYLGKHNASRATFETVLIYDPENTSAYFGLQYFKEKRQAVRIAVLWSISIAILCFLGISLFAGLRSLFLDRISVVSESTYKIEENLRGDLAGLEHSIEERIARQQETAARNAREMADIATILEQTNERLEDVMRDVNEMLFRMDRSVMRLDEEYTSLFNSIEELFDVIRSLRFGLYLF